MISRRPRPDKISHDGSGIRRLPLVRHRSRKSLTTRIANGSYASRTFAIGGSPTRLDGGRPRELHPPPRCPGCGSGRPAHRRLRPSRREAGSESETNEGKVMARAAGSDAEGLAAIQEAGAAIAPLHEPIRPPGRGDWLHDHPEPGQTFDDYRQERPVLPAGRAPPCTSSGSARSSPRRARRSRRPPTCSAGSTAVPVRVLGGMGPVVIPAGPGGGTRTRGTSSC